MDAAESRLERNDHTAFIHNHTLYVWGGCQIGLGLEEDVALPSDEIWLCDLDSGAWERREIRGDKPPDLTGSCGSYSNGTFYIFAGCDSQEYTNEMFSLDLTEQHYSWKKVTDTEGTTPSPRSKHSCWVHRGRLIYFGGYGWKSLAEMQDTSSSNFAMEDMSWATIGNAMLRFWGWNSEVSVFDTHTVTWSRPNTQGDVPSPRCSHTSALLGNKGYICGGTETTDLDMFCLDLQTWTWTELKTSQACVPLGRSMFTMTPISDHSLFVFGGLGINGDTLKDTWQFDTQSKKWTEVKHPFKDKTRACHTACLGSDNDVVVFGGSSQIDIMADSITILRLPKQTHCRDTFIFQTQPYSLFRLCNDFIGRNPDLFEEQLNWLPTKLRSRIDKRVAFFSTMADDDDEARF